MTGELYLTQDKKTAIIVNNELIYTFTLVSPEGDSVLFKKINRSTRNCTRPCS